MNSPVAVKPGFGTSEADRPARQWRLLTVRASALAAMAGILWINALDVRLSWVRGLYGVMCVWLVVFYLEQQFRHWQIRNREAQLNSNSFGNSWFQSAVRISLAVTTLLLALEAGARALPPLTSSSLLYPGGKFVWPDRGASRNSLGLNDSEPAPITQHPRILVLGDSYVEGAGVRRTERFCSRLQQILQSSHAAAQVIAGGVSGWNTRQEAQFLERYGEALAPDVVVVAYVLNDADGSGPQAARSTPWEQWLQTRLRSYLCYRILRKRRGDDARYWQIIQQQHQRGSSSWRDVDESLARIAHWCRDRNVPCHLVVLPIFTPLADQGRSVTEQVVARGGELGMQSYHTLDDFDAHWELFAVSPYDAHPNADGHDRLARRLARELQSALGSSISD